MATTANPPPGAIPTNGIADPFIGSPTYAPRYASLDIEQFSSNSPTQAKRALEAHLKDTDRRIQDASRLGTTLIQQRKDLSTRLQEVSEVQQNDEVPEDLRKKLADLEKEYNEVGKESARAFLPKAKVTDVTATPSAFSGSGRESPTKVTAPSRKQRNQPSSRVHDIEFATEISTSLLAQVRQLQAALAEKDEELKDTTAAKAQLESDHVGLAQRIKHLDDNEQRYKDENWNLETRLQELEGSHKEAIDREQRVTQSLKSTQSEKASAQRDLDDLKVSHEKLNEEHAVVKRQQETDLHGLRRDVASHETEKSTLQKKIEDLTSQNTELAKAVSYRFNQPSAATHTDFISANEDLDRSDGTPDESAPESPVKGTPRHGMLESETLKSSLNHAHRMIQNLKNNIHREKTEKIELKRMLQDARDELETRRSESSSVGANVGKKRRSDTDNNKFRKPARPLGANRTSTTEVMEDEPDWEDDGGTSTPSRMRNIPGAFAMSSTETEAETTDAAFETATERGGTSDAFETGRESAPGDNDSDELTETEETNVNRASTVVRRNVSGLVGQRAGNRASFQSTASLSGDEGDDAGVSTPLQAAQQPKYRLRMKNGKRGDRVGDLARDSPASASSASGTPQRAGQSLGDELDALDEGTPRSTDSTAATPETSRHVTPGRFDDDETNMGTPILDERDEEPSLARESNKAMLAHESVVSKPSYADAGMMTEPWEPEPTAGKEVGLKERAAEVVGGALAGFGFGRFAKGKDADPGAEADAGAEKDISRPVSVSETRDFAAEPEPKSLHPAAFGQSDIVSQETLPATPDKRVTALPLNVQTANLHRKQESLDFSPVVAQQMEPRTPLLPKRSSRRLDALPVPVEEATSSEEEPVTSIPGTDGARPGTGFFGIADTAKYRGVNGETGTRTALEELSSNTVSRDVGKSERDSAGLMPLISKKAMSDEGSQTVVSGDDIENMLRNKNRVLPAPVVIGMPARPSTAIGPDGARSLSNDEMSNEMAGLRTPRRPASAGNMRNKAAAGIIAPPLPEDRALKIAAAAHKGPSTASAGTMGPPLFPASAYKQKRPMTPAENTRMSRDGTTPRARQVQSPAGTQTSRRTSLSSFASEVDERLNGPAQFLYPEGVQPSTDPRMIQAITQTMIGEYLWKYTRKAGRSDTSNSRHRRFFWVHPYTRTLYWSEKDPSTAGKEMLKAKSVAIDAVRVVSDDNAYPPGLHRKSLVVVTPGREIVFTAPTGQRHETWFNALSYLLLRTEQEKELADDGINQDDIDEFNPGFGGSIRRSISRMTGRSQSRVSLSSYNSRTTRNSSASRGQRQSATGTATSRSVRPQSPTLKPNDSTASRYSTVRDSNGGRLSTLTSKFRPSNAQRGSYNSTGRGQVASTSTRGRQTGSEIYDASVAADSAEDLRAVIERQEADADRLENVRACCDGKHDVGSLSRRSRHASLGSRFNAHSHSHGPGHVHSHVGTAEAIGE